MRLSRTERARWKVSLVLFVCLLALTLTTMSALAVDLKQNNLAWWAHDDLNTELNDSSGNGRIGIEVGNPTYQQAGVVAESVLYDDAGDLFRTNKDFGDGLAGMTIAGWVKVDGSSADPDSILVKSNGPAPRAWAFTVNANETLNAQVFDNGGGSHVCQSKTKIATGVFVQVGMIFDAGNIRLFVNGSEVATQSDTDATCNNAYTMQNDGSTVSIGAFNNSANEMDGNIDELAIWSVASEDIITDHWNSGDGFNPYDVVNVLTVRASDVVDSSLVQGLCVTADNGTLLTKCNATGTNVYFNETELALNTLYDFDLSSVGVGSQSSPGTYFNSSQDDYNFTTIASLNIDTFQSWIRLTTTQRYTDSTILSYNSTNGGVTNQTSNGTLLLQAKNGSNNVEVAVNGNYSQNYTFTITQPLSTQNFTATGVYDTRYTFTAQDIFTGAALNTFTILAENTSITASATNSTTAGSLFVPLMQGFFYNVQFQSEDYAWQNKTLHANASTHSYQFEAYTTNSINITIYDEENNVVIVGTNITIEFISTPESRTESTTTGSVYADLLTPAEYTLKLSATGYHTRFYEFTLTNNTFNELNLSLLDTTNGTSVTITVKDTLDNPLEGKTVKVLKYDVTTNQPELISVLTTNFEGQALASIILNDELYQFIVQDADGTVLKTTSLTQVYGTSLTLVVDLISESGFEDVFTSYRISGNLTYQAANSRYRYTFNDESNTASQACVTVYSLSEQKTVYNQTCASSSAGTIYAGIDNSSGNAYQIIGTVTSNGVEYLVDTQYKSFASTIPEDGSGLLMMAFMILTFVFALAVNVEIAVIVASMVPLLFSAMGLTRLDFTITVPLFALGVVLAFILGVTRR